MSGTLFEELEEFKDKIDDKPTHIRKSGKEFFGAEDERKICNNCNVEKPVQSFGAARIDHHNRLYTKNECLECCERNRKLVKYYTIKYAHTKPKNCDICKKEKKLYLDHCHKTGNFRGWLCKNCNMSIGYLYDNSQNLIYAIEYLHKEPIATPKDIETDQLSFTLTFKDDEK